MVLKHLANVIVFGRSVVKRSHGQKHERILDLVLYQKRDVQLAGAVSPHKHFRQPFVAGPAGHRQGATGAGCRQLQSGSAGGWAAWYGPEGAKALSNCEAFAPRRRKQV